MLYLLCFLLSFFFLIFRTNGVIAVSIFKGKITCNIFVWIALFFPVALAGFRDVSVGTDTINYVNNFIDIISANSTDEFLSVVKIYRQGAGYQLVMWFSSII